MASHFRKVCNGWNLKVVEWLIWYKWHKKFKQRPLLIDNSANIYDFDSLCHSVWFTDLTDLQKSSKHAQIRSLEDKTPMKIFIYERYYAIIKRLKTKILPKHTTRCRRRSKKVIKNIFECFVREWRRWEIAGTFLEKMDKHIEICKCCLIFSLV